MNSGPALFGWYYKRNGQRIGPLAIEEVAHLLDAGKLLPSEMLVEIAEERDQVGSRVRYDYLDAATAVGRHLPARRF